MTVNLSKVDLDSDMMGKPSKRHPERRHDAESTNTKKSKPGPKSRSLGCEKASTSAKRKLSESDQEKVVSSKRSKGGTKKSSTNKQVSAVSLPTDKPTDEKEKKINFRTKSSKSTQKILGENVGFEAASSTGRRSSLSSFGANESATTNETTTKHDQDLSVQVEKAKNISVPVTQERKTLESPVEQTSPIGIVRNTLHPAKHVGQTQISAPKALLVQNPPFFARKSAPKIVQPEEEVSLSSRIPIKVPNQKPGVVVNAYAKTGPKSVSLATRSASPDNPTSSPVQLATTKTENSSKTDPALTTKVKENILIKTAIEKIRHTPDNLKISSMIDELFNNVMDCYKTDDMDGKTEKMDKKMDEMKYNLDKKDEKTKKANTKTNKMDNITEKTNEATRKTKIDQMINKVDDKIETTEEQKSISELISCDIVNQLVDIAVSLTYIETPIVNAEIDRNTDCDGKSNSEVESSSTFCNNLPNSKIDLKPEELHLVDKESKKASEVLSDSALNLTTEAVENEQQHAVELKQAIEQEQVVEKEQVVEMEQVVEQEQDVEQEQGVMEEEIAKKEEAVEKKQVVEQGQEVEQELGVTSVQIVNEDKAVEHEQAVEHELGVMEVQIVNEDKAVEQEQAVEHEQDITEVLVVEQEQDVEQEQGIVEVVIAIEDKAVEQEPVVEQEQVVEEEGQTFVIENNLREKNVTELEKAVSDFELQNIEKVIVDDESVVPVKQVSEIGQSKNRQQKSLEIVGSSDKPALESQCNIYQSPMSQNVVDIKAVIQDILNDVLRRVVLHGQTLPSKDSPDIWEALLATARPAPEMVSISSPEMRLSSEIETDAEDESSLFLAGRVDLTLRNCLPYQVYFLISN